VDISIDFRNQNQGAGTATPMQIETETKTLTTEWQQFSMNSTAPTDAPNPVYSNRVTFQAGTNDTVHVDQVTTTVPEPSAWLQLIAGTGCLLLLRRGRSRDRQADVPNL